MPQTRQTRCWPSSKRTTNPSLRRQWQSSRSLSLVLLHRTRLRWASAGTLFEVMSPAELLRFQFRPTSGPNRRFFSPAEVYSPRPETSRKSPHIAPTGSTGSTAGTPWASSLSARRSSMSRLPLLRRTTPEMPILLSASRFCRIRRDTFLGVMCSAPAGSIFSDSSVGVPINSVRTAHQFREEINDAVAQQFRLRSAVCYQLPHIFTGALQ